MATPLPLPDEWWCRSYALFLLLRRYLLIRSLPLTPLEFTNLTSDSRIKSLLTDVIASSFASRLHDKPVRFKELQFWELTVKEGASAAPVHINRCSIFNYRVVMLLGAGGWPVLLLQGPALRYKSLFISGKNDFCLWATSVSCIVAGSDDACIRFQAQHNYTAWPKIHAQCQRDPVYYISDQIIWRAE